VGIGVDFGDGFRTKSFRITLPPPPAAASLDIKPGSFPNPFNRNSNGVLPVALCGTDSLDAAQVDLASLRLRRADGVGGEVAPHEGPPGPHTTLADVATPFYGEGCAGHELEGDGIKDVSMKFRSNEVTALLELGELESGATVELVLTGSLMDGGSFEASDCITLVPQGSPPGMLTVESNLVAWVETLPADDQLDEGGFTSFSRTYPIGTVVTLRSEAFPAAYPGWVLKGWMIDGELVPRSGLLETLRVRIDSEVQNVSLVYARRRFQDAPTTDIGDAGRILR